MIGIKVKHTFYPLGPEHVVTAFFSTVFYYVNDGRKWGERYPHFFNELYQGKVTIKEMQETKTELIHLKAEFLSKNPKVVYWDLFKGEEFVPVGVEGISKSSQDLFMSAVGTDFFDLLINKCDECLETGWDMIMHNMFKRPDIQIRAEQDR